MKDNALTLIPLRNDSVVRFSGASDHLLQLLKWSLAVEYQPHNAAPGSFQRVFLVPTHLAESGAVLPVKYVRNKLVPMEMLDLRPTEAYQYEGTRIDLVGDFVLAHDGYAALAFDLVHEAVQWAARKRTHSSYISTVPVAFYMTEAEVEQIMMDDGTLSTELFTRLANTFSNVSRRLYGQPYVVLDKKTNRIFETVSLYELVIDNHQPLSHITDIIGSGVFAGCVDLSPRYIVVGGSRMPALIEAIASGLADGAVGLATIIDSELLKRTLKAQADKG